MFNKQLIVIDIETSGPNLDYDIIQFGAVKLDKDFNIIEIFERLVKPTTDLWDEHSFKVHNISKEKCTNEGISIEDCVSQFERFVGMTRNFSLSSWGIFDINFLTTVYKRLNRKFIFSYRTYDISSIARFIRWTKNINIHKSIGLEDSAKSFGLDVDSNCTHNALYDATKIAFNFSYLITFKDNI